MSKPINDLFSSGVKLRWCDPEPIENNDYTITYLEYEEGYEMAFIRYNGGMSSAEVFPHEIHPYPPSYISLEVTHLPNSKLMAEMAIHKDGQVFLREGELGYQLKAAGIELTEANLINFAKARCYAHQIYNLTIKTVDYEFGDRIECELIYFYL